MAALTFNVTLNNLTDEPREVVGAVVFNDPGAPGADGAWNLAGPPGVFTLVSTAGVVGTSGALRIKRVGIDEVGYIVAFGYWNANGQKWIGVAGAADDVPAPVLPASAATVLPQFYGGGVYNVQEVFWTQNNIFHIHNPATPEDIAIIVNNVDGALNAVVTIA